MQLNEMITVQSDTYDPVTQKRLSTTRRGTVRFIHPLRRYYTVEYDNGIKESFFFQTLPPEPESRAGYHHSRGGNRSRKYKT
jgi:hypothetical protein